MWVPKNMPIEHEIIDTANRRVAAFSDGVVYTITLSSIYRSDNWGQTWETVATGIDPDAAPLRKVAKLNSGRLLAVTDANIWLSDENENNFEVVYNINSERLATVYFGMSVYDDVITLCDYTSAAEAWLSVDGGMNWHKIFDASKITSVSHTHAIQYDPYENLIWMTFGDGYDVRDQIAWSDNWGETWEFLPVGEQRRVTSVMPLPSCVLFGSDEHEWLGVYRMDRPLKGTHSSEFKTTIAWQARGYYSSPTNDMGWLTTPAISYGSECAAYFGARHGRGMRDVPASCVYGTKDGKRFYTLWADKTIPSTPSSIPHVYGVFGPDNDGNLVASLEWKDGESYLWKGLRIKDFGGWEWVQD